MSVRGAMERSLAHDALTLLLGEGEWHAEHWHGAQGHSLVCITCGASYANVTEDNAVVMHRPACKRAAIFAIARQLDLIPPRRP
jgi:hypothetical protein